MGHRLSSIVTRTGDAGTTGLGDGSRVAKSDLRVHAMGDVDELNSCIGLLLAVGRAELEGLPAGPGRAALALLEAVQQDLFAIGGELSIPGYLLLAAERVAALDEWLAAANADLPRLTEFVVPGGTVATAQAHVCRAVCRRAERSVVALGAAQQGGAGEPARQYLNRLSDALFVLARLLNRAARDDGEAEPQWQRAGPR